MARKKVAEFQRARHPAQIEQRQEAILHAALTLFLRRGLENVSLNDIAREVGLAKSSIYRYFDSREHIFLIILQRLAAAFEERIYPPLEKLRGKGTVTKVAKVLVDTYINSPEYGELITVVNSVLERRLTPELIANFRSVFLERRKRLAAALTAALVGAAYEKMLPLTLHIFLHVPGLWTFCFPSEESLTLLNESSHAHLKLDFRQEMTLFLHPILQAAIATEPSQRIHNTANGDVG
ncbi:TetR family transcriptional regulator [Nostoc sp.]|uniref:TetR family transcriptional regulator n=1 Tax=Nostoc sp. TaxID=1180 RepID=UPI002FFC6C9E